MLGSFFIPETPGIVAQCWIRGASNCRSAHAGSHAPLNHHKPVAVLLSLPSPLPPNPSPLPSTGSLSRELSLATTISNLSSRDKVELRLTRHQPRLRLRSQPQLQVLAAARLPLGGALFQLTSLTPRPSCLGPVLTVHDSFWESLFQTPNKPGSATSGLWMAGHPSGPQFPLLSGQNDTRGSQNCLQAGSAGMAWGRHWDGSPAM